MRQKLASVSGVFTRDQVGFLKDAQRAKTDVFKISYRGRDNVQGSSQSLFASNQTRNGRDLSSPKPFGESRRQAGDTKSAMITAPNSKRIKDLTSPNSLHYSVPELDHNPIM